MVNLRILNLNGRDFMIRRPAVAGTFYESHPESLKKRIEWCFKHELGPGKLPKFGDKREIKGVVAPHAGFIYSGPVAAHSYYEIVKDGFPETFVILCPNHTGMGSGVAVATEEKWNTPLGDVEIDYEFASQLWKKSGIIDSDSSSHSQEHSCEVHLPFLQYFSNNFQIVPVSMGMQDLETSNEIANAINKVALKLNRDLVVIASTDFTHYQPQDIASQNDNYVLESIRLLDEQQMMQRVFDLNVTMCGYGPVATNILFSKMRGSLKGEILKYATSGDITGDHSSVVGYASAIFR
jgi:AmmeMemoRadiSam system protein B